jgi:hypothetical protein
MIAKVKVEFDGLARRGDQDEFQDKPQRPLPRYQPHEGGPEASPLATPGAGKGSEATPAPEEPEAFTDHSNGGNEQDGGNMEDLMRKYGEAVEVEMEKFVEEYGQEFISNLDDEDIEAFASIFAERVDLMNGNAAPEGEG